VAGNPNEHAEDTEGERRRVINMHRLSRSSRYVRPQLAGRRPSPPGTASRLVVPVLRARRPGQTDKSISSRSACSATGTNGRARALSPECSCSMPVAIRLADHALSSVAFATLVYRIET
jgi:hypothetical protein